MQRDILFLLKPDFADPAYPDKRFYCWHCALLEGVLASFPDLAPRLDVRRVAWTRPRADVIALVGLENPSLPMLIFAPDAPEDVPAKVSGRVRYLDDKDAILDLLSRRHGFAEPHP